MPKRRSEYFEPTGKINDLTLLASSPLCVAALVIAYQALRLQPESPSGGFTKVQAQTRRDAKRAIVEAMTKAGWEFIKEKP